jgi:hypothetical protein
MWLTRLTPKNLLAAVVAQAAVLLALLLSAEFHWRTFTQPSSGNFRNMTSIAAFAVAFALNLEIAREYRKTPLLHLAWLALAANAGISVIRMIFEGFWIGVFWSGYHKSMRGLLQHVAIVPANLCLLVGVIAMCVAYHRVGLGFEITRRDCYAMALIAAVLIASLTFREGLTETNSLYPAGRWLQRTGLIQLAVISAVSVLLHRMAIQMGGGQLAKVLMLITFYTLGRSSNVFLSAIRPTLPTQAQFFVRVVVESAWLVIVWLPALAAAYRMQMTAAARRSIQQLERDKFNRVAAPVSA